MNMPGVAAGPAGDVMDATALPKMEPVVPLLLLLLLLLLALPLVGAVAAAGLAAPKVNGDEAAPGTAPLATPNTDVPPVGGAAGAA